MLAADASRSDSLPLVRLPSLRTVANGTFFVALVAVAVAVALASAVAPRLLGYESLALTSGSMGRAAPVGSLVLTRSVPAADVEAGNVIAVKRPGRSIFVHRVISLATDGGRPTARTKGDANSSPDPEPYPLPDRTQVVAHTTCLDRLWTTE